MTFGAAAFLLGLLALGLPWWLHRRRSRPPHARAVASLQLMQATPEPRQRRRALSHRWLLAARCLLLAGAALAFAQPLLPRTAGPAAAAGTPTLPQLFVLDTSLSMSAGIGRAKATVRALLDELPPGTPAGLVTAGSELELAAPLDGDHERLRAALAAAQPDGSRLAFGGLLARSLALGSGPAAGPVALHLVSDFQASGLPGQFNDLLPDEPTPVNLHPVAGVAGNRALVALTVGGGQAVVTARRFGTGAGRAAIVLTADGREVGRRRLELAAAYRTVTFALPQEAAAGQRWRAAFAQADALPADDAVYAVANVGEPLPLPLFADAGSAMQQTYLKAALAAGEVGFVPAAEDARGPVAVLLDPGELEPLRARLLARHLEEGGSVLITAGPATESAGRVPVIDVPLSADRLDRSPRPVTVLARRHPLFDAAGDDAVAAQWRDVRVSHLVVPEALGAAEVLVATEAWRPLLLDVPLGAGRALVLTTALEPGWSNLAASPVFVRLVTDALAYLGGDLLPERAVAGERLTLPGSGVQVFDAAGSALLDLQDTVSRSGFRVRHPGSYLVRTPNRSHLLAVNADVRESDPAPAAPALLERWQGAVRGGPAPAVAAAGPVALPGAAAQEGGWWALAPWLLALLLIVAVVEMAAANLSRPEVADG